MQKPYNLSENETNHIEDVNNQTEMMPNTLYKYRYFDKNGYHIKLIEDAELWFTSAQELNDPFDSTLHFDTEDNPKGIRKKWAMDYVRRTYPHFNRKERVIFVKDRLKELKKDPDHWTWFQQNYIEIVYKTFGMCCLSRFRDNLLMWPHYSCNHTGFCVGFDTFKLIKLFESLATNSKLIEIIKVCYKQERPHINYFQSRLSSDWKNDITTLLRTKSIHWKIEEEYRLICWHHPNEPIYIGHECINEIILGCKIEESNKSKLKGIYKRLGMDAKVFQAQKSNSEFALDFPEIHW